MFSKLTTGDQSDGSHFCVPVDTLTAGKFLYYGAKLLQLLERLPPPIP